MGARDCEWIGARRGVDGCIVVVSAKTGEETTLLVKKHRLIKKKRKDA